jgi:hypothetical protein
MILCDWVASEGNPGQSCIHLYARILSTSSTSVSIFSVWCYSSVSISMGRRGESVLLYSLGCTKVAQLLLYNADSPFDMSVRITVVD